MQFPGKLKNKTLKNDKKPSFSCNFGPFDPNLAPKFFFPWILPLLDVRHCCKLLLNANSWKSNEPNLRKYQKSSSGPKFGAQNFICDFYLN